MSLELTPTGGRYPGGRVLYETANILARLEQREDKVKIRIEDKAHADRWETFTISTAALLAALFSHRPDGEDESVGEIRDDENN